MSKEKCGVSIETEILVRAAPYHERSGEEERLYDNRSRLFEGAVKTHIALLEHLEKEGQIDHHDDPDWLSENVFGTGSPETLEECVRKIVREELTKDP